MNPSRIMGKDVIVVTHGVIFTKLQPLLHTSQPVILRGGEAYP